MITVLIERLLQYAAEKGLLGHYDEITARNMLYDLLKVRYDEIPDDYTPMQSEETAAELTVILEGILDHCAAEGILTENGITYRDLMDARIMGLLMPRQSEIEKEFYAAYALSKEQATSWFYELCCKCNYIQTDRIRKNLYWQAETEFGNMEITVNLAKPEKDPNEIAAAKLLPDSCYPKCLLCVENVGFAGNLNHPARQNLRVVPVTLNNEEWFFQYSPYVYYNEHCIVLNKRHTPMGVTKETFIRLLEFIDLLPHYFIGANAGLPIVGGSILSHDHFQGGRHVFPMETAPSYAFYRQDGYEDIKVSLLKWPLPVIRISGADKCRLISLSMDILNEWRSYSDEEREIRAFTGSVPHNAITPIARKNKDGLYELDLVLRNNRTSDEHPLGIFHPHAELHHIKKENIGLIEVMGLAVLPGRLDTELKAIARRLTGGGATPGVEDLTQHEPWMAELTEKYGGFSDEGEMLEILRKETGIVFMKVLCDAGVFKADDDGRHGFHEFMKNAGFERMEDYI